ncbi:MAG: hypothetical protein N2651_07535, partial [Fimbriimonadales bacterium]|nr:hypothetical protein [Fimbriimonadales bacterium]
LTVQAVMTYKGQPIATEADTLTVIYNIPPAWLRWLGGLFCLAGLVVLPSKRIPVYQHTLQLQNPTYGTRNTYTLSPQEPQLTIENRSVVLEYMKGSKQVQLVEGTLLTLDGRTLEGGSLLRAGEQYRTLSGNILTFCETENKGKQAIAPRFVPNTVPKILLVLVGLALISYHWFLKHQLGQLTNL